jgi:hypothetical protein
MGGGENDITPELGNIFVSAPANSLDWALVEIENFDLMLEDISLNNRRMSIMLLLSLRLLKQWQGL